jgi:hypothetical protein
VVIRPPAGALGLALALAQAAAPPLARAARAPCSASASVFPAQAVAGQQLLYAVRIARRDDVARVEWSEAPRFPDFRAEWLPGRAEDTELRVGDVHFMVREEHRAIFPLRSGSLVIPEAELRCVVPARGEQPQRIVSARVAATPVRVAEAPRSPRPADWSGVVGPVQVQTLVDPLALPLGGALRVSVLLRGTGNLWDAAPPFPAGDAVAAFGGAEVFARPAELDLQAGSRLQVRRAFRFDVVPARPGLMVVPEVRVPWYDPVAGRYEVARAEAVEVRVEPPPAAYAPKTPRSEPVPGGSSRGEAARDGAERVALPVPPKALALLGALVVGGGALAAVELWLRHRRPWREVERALEAADGAAAVGDRDGESAELARALRLAVAAHRRAPELAGLAADELRERCAARASPALATALDELARLDRLRFSPDRAGPHRAAVERAIARLR